MRLIYITNAMIKIVASIPNSVRNCGGGMQFYVLISFRVCRLFG